MYVSGKPTSLDGAMGHPQTRFHSTYPLYSTVECCWHVQPKCVVVGVAESRFEVQISLHIVYQYTGKSYHGNIFVEGDNGVLISQKMDFCYRTLAAYANANAV